MVPGERTAAGRGSQPRGGYRIQAEDKSPPGLAEDQSPPGLAGKVWIYELPEQDAWMCAPESWHRVLQNLKARSQVEPGTIKETLQ